MNLPLNHCAEFRSTMMDGVDCVEIFSNRPLYFDLLAMPDFPPNMRTGYDMPGIRTEDVDLSEWLRFMDAVFLAFAQKAFGFACQYAQAAGRGHYTTATDCTYGLKYAAHTFLHDDDFESRTLQVRSLMDECDREMMDEDVEEDRSSESDGKSSDIEEGECVGERRSEYQDDEPKQRVLSDEIIDQVLYQNYPDGVVDDSDFPPFCRAPETSDWVVRVHEAVDNWDDWNPTDPVERLLKGSISIVNNLEENGPERTRPDVAFRQRRSRTLRRSTAEPSE